MHCYTVDLAMLHYVYCDVVPPLLHPRFITLLIGHAPVNPVNIETENKIEVFDLKHLNKHLQTLISNASPP